MGTVCGLNVATNIYKRIVLLQLRKCAMLCGPPSDSVKKKPGPFPSFKLPIPWFEKIKTVMLCCNRCQLFTGICIILNSPFWHKTVLVLLLPVFCICPSAVVLFMVYLGSRSVWFSLKFVRFVLVSSVVLTLQFDGRFSCSVFAAALFLFFIFFKVNVFGSFLF